MCGRHDLTPDMYDSEPEPVPPGFRGPVYAALLSSLLLLGSATPTAASGTNRFVYLRAAPALGVRAQLALGAAEAAGEGFADGALIPRPGGSQSVWIAVGGSGFLDIIQVGAMVRGDGTRVLFAAWGRGNPGADGSLWEERELGPVDRSWHAYELRLSAGTWIVRIDGAIRLRVPDSFRDWTVREAKCAVEAEPPSALLGGSASLPARVKAARVLIDGAWVLPLHGSYGASSWYQGGYAVPVETSSAFGRDWLKAWRP